MAQGDLSFLNSHSLSSVAQYLGHPVLKIQCIALSQTPLIPFHLGVDEEINVFLVLQANLHSLERLAAQEHSFDLKEEIWLFPGTQMLSPPDKTRTRKNRNTRLKRQWWLLCEWGIWWAKLTTQCSHLPAAHSPHSPGFAALVSVFLWRLVRLKDGLSTNQVDEQDFEELSLGCLYLLCLAFSNNRSMQPDRLLCKGKAVVFKKFNNKTTLILLLISRLEWIVSWLTLKNSCLCQLDTQQGNIAMQFDREDGFHSPGPRNHSTDTLSWSAFFHYWNSSRQKSHLPEFAYSQFSFPCSRVRVWSSLGGALESNPGWLYSLVNHFAVLN